MSREDEGWTRTDFARWFIDHDDVDEAARMLEPGDQLALGRSDGLDLKAALDRRGLGASYDSGQLQVLPPAAGARKPPLRATPVASTPAKKQTA